jgi:hypothetical protein
MRDGKILLVPHFDTDAGPVQWDIPGGGITITFIGQVVDGKLSPETDHPYGKKMPRWFTALELKGIKYHPKTAVEKALGM